MQKVQAETLLKSKCRKVSLL